MSADKPCGLGRGEEARPCILGVSGLDVSSKLPSTVSVRNKNEWLKVEVKINVISKNFDLDLDLNLLELIANLLKHNNIKYNNIII